MASRISITAGHVQVSMSAAALLAAGAALWLWRKTAAATAGMVHGNNSGSKSQHAGGEAGIFGSANGADGADEDGAEVVQAGVEAYEPELDHAVEATTGRRLYHVTLFGIPLATTENPVMLGATIGAVALLCLLAPWLNSMLSSSIVHSIGLVGLGVALRSFSFTRGDAVAAVAAASAAVTRPVLASADPSLRGNAAIQDFVASPVTRTPHHRHHVAHPPVTATHELEIEDFSSAAAPAAPAPLPAAGVATSAPAPVAAAAAPAATDNSADEQVKPVLAQAQELHQARRFNEVESLLTPWFDRRASLSRVMQGEVCWRLAQNCARQAFEITQERVAGTPAQIAELNKRGYMYAAKAVEANPESGQAHRWAGTLLSRQEGTTKDKIQNGFLIQKHFQEAIRLNPNDPIPCHLLGQWSYACAALTWIERKAATALFGKPPSATYDDAIALFHNAERLQPGFWMTNRLMLAKSYLAAGRNAEAKAWIEKALSMQLTLDEDKAEFQEARQLARKLGVAAP